MIAWLFVLWFVAAPDQSGQVRSPEVCVERYRACFCRHEPQTGWLCDGYDLREIASEPQTHAPWRFLNESIRSKL